MSIPQPTLDRVRELLRRKAPDFMDRIDEDIPVYTQGDPLAVLLAGHLVVDLFDDDSVADLIGTLIDQGASAGFIVGTPVGAGATADLISYVQQTLPATSLEGMLKEGSGE